MDRLSGILGQMAGIFGEDAQRLVEAYPGAALHMVAAILILLMAILISSIVVTLRERRRPSPLARPVSAADDSRTVHDTPRLHASLFDGALASFTFFTLLAAGFSWLVTFPPAGRLDIFGVSLAEAALPLAGLLAIFALIALLEKWFWARSFSGWTEWVGQRRRDVAAFQLRTLGKRARLNAGERQAAELEDASRELVQPPASDRFATFLQSRKPQAFRLARPLRKGRADQAWQIGEIESAVDDRYGYIRERTSGSSSGNMSEPRGLFYFNRATTASEGLGAEGDMAFFVTAERGPDPADAPPAYLVCIQGKPCRGYVRQNLSSRTCLVEIADGFENFTAIPALLDTSLVATGTPLKPGDRIEGTVTHNALGVMLKDVKRIAAP